MELQLQLSLRLHLSLRLQLSSKHFPPCTPSTLHMISQTYQTTSLMKSDLSRSCMRALLSFFLSFFFLVSSLSGSPLCLPLSLLFCFPFSGSVDATLLSLVWWPVSWCGGQEGKTVGFRLAVSLSKPTVFPSPGSLALQALLTLISVPRD